MTYNEASNIAVEASKTKAEIDAISAINREEINLLKCRISELQADSKDKTEALETKLELLSYAIRTFKKDNPDAKLDYVSWRKGGYEIESIKVDMLPSEYLTADEDKINKMVKKLGKNHGIDGVKVKQKEDTLVIKSYVNTDAEANT